MKAANIYFFTLKIVLYSKPMLVKFNLRLYMITICSNALYVCRTLVTTKKKYIKIA